MNTVEREGRGKESIMTEREREQDRERDSQRQSERE